MIYGALIVQTIINFLGGVGIRFVLGLLSVIYEDSWEFDKSEWDRFYEPQRKYKNVLAWVFVNERRIPGDLTAQSHCLQDIVLENEASKSF